MATNFPSSQDNFVNPTSSDTLDSPDHAAQHTDVNDAVEAIELALLDGAPLHIDDANERVGVGTTSPSTELEVDGTVTATEFVGHLQGPTHIRVKNTSGGSLSKGTPVYATGSVGASGAVEVQASLAGTASTMPALGLLDETLAHNGVGSATVIGVIRQVDTSSYSVNDELYVAVSGGLTATRPSGASELVQKIGRVVRADASTGEILVLGAGRSNDVPNGLSPTITLAGDASGSVTLTNLGNGTLTVAVNDDSHNHTIANVDNLQTTLDGKAASSHSHSYLPLTGGTVTGQTTFSATDGVKLTGPSGGVWFDDRNGDGSKWVAYHSGSFLGLWNGSVTPFQFNDTGELLIEDTHSSELLDVYRTGSAPGNSVTALFRNQYANHSWGVIAEFRIEGNSGSDRPAVLFSSGQTSTTWTVGYDYNNDEFGIRQNRGYRNGGWGNSRLKIDTVGRTTIYTDSGYVQLGAHNAGYCHFFTDRPRNYFNVGLTVDTGVVSSYDEDLSLRRADSEKLKLDSSGAITYGRHYVTGNLDGAGVGNFSGHVETNQGMVVYGDTIQSSINGTYAGRSSIQLATDTYWGGCNTTHTGFLIASGGMCGWGTSQLYFRGSNNWSSYYTSAALRLQGTKAHFTMGPETTYDVYADGSGRIGYFGSRRDLKNIVGYIPPEESLSRIKQLRPVDFTWKKEHRPSGDNTELIDFDVYRGFIAEEVAEVDRTMATWGWLYKEGDSEESKVGDTMTEELSRSDKTIDDAEVVSYDQRAIIADLVGSVQALEARIAELEAA